MTMYLWLSGLKLAIAWMAFFIVCGLGRFRIWMLLFLRFILRLLDPFVVGGQGSFARTCRSTALRMHALGTERNLLAVLLANL